MATDEQLDELARLLIPRLNAAADKCVTIEPKQKEEPPDPRAGWEIAAPGPEPKSWTLEMDNSWRYP